MKGHKDKTADEAVGTVDKEWRYMANLALKIRQGRVNPIWAEKESARFTGIFKRLLTDPIDEVKKETRG